MVHATFSAFSITALDKISLEGRPHSPLPHNPRMCFLCLTFPSPQILSQLLLQNPLSAFLGTSPALPQHTPNYPLCFSPPEWRNPSHVLHTELSLESTGIDGVFCRHTMGLQRIRQDWATSLSLFCRLSLKERVYSLWVEGCDELSSSPYSSVAGLGAESPLMANTAALHYKSSRSRGHLGLWIWSLTSLPTPNLGSIPKTAFTRPILTQRPEYSPGHIILKVLLLLSRVTLHLEKLVLTPGDNRDVDW